MKKLLLILLIVGVVILSGCTQKSEVSPQIMMCQGIYYLHKSLNREINTDQEAFDILKEGVTYDTKNNTVWVEDHIPEDMTVEEALEGFLKKDKEIKLESGETISPVWVIGYGEHKALDKKGNIYVCKGIKLS